VKFKKDVNENSKKNGNAIVQLQKIESGNLKKFKRDPKKLAKNLLKMQRRKQISEKKN